jgi:hypothetical protein
VCKNSAKWASEVCENEIVDENENSFEPMMSVKSGNINGPFISLDPITKDIVFTDNCHFENKRGDDEMENHLVHVKCGNSRCGISKTDEKSEMRERKVKRNKRKSENDQNSEEIVKEARIVGGSKIFEF